MWSATNPFLKGFFEPLYDEYSISELRVEGEIPRELNGTLYRNTSNQRFRPFNPDQTHWFEGDAMRISRKLDFRGNAPGRKRSTSKCFFGTAVRLKIE